MLAAHSKPVVCVSPLVRLTSAARLARMRVVQPLEVADPNILHTARLTIRPLGKKDGDEFGRVIAISRAHIERHCPLHREAESDDRLFERLLDMARRGFETGLAWRTGIFDADRRLVGLMNLNNIVRGLESQGEANWWIAADSTGRGYATEALRAVVAHAFADLPCGLGLQRVMALIAPDNIASRRVAAKAGLRRDHSTGADKRLVLNGRAILHETFQAFAPLTASRRAASRKPSLRAGLASILSTEDAIRLRVG